MMSSDTVIFKKWDKPLIRHIVFPNGVQIFPQEGSKKIWFGTPNWGKIKKVIVEGARGLNMELERKGDQLVVVTNHLTHFSKIGEPFRLKEGESITIKDLMKAVLS